MKVLVTGGAGYIGSHTCLELLEAGHQVVVLDNLVNANEESLHRVRRLTGCDLEFHQLDLLDRPGLRQFLAGKGLEAVIHFAGLKAVGESVEIPLAYYQNNITGTLNLCEVMAELAIKTLVFSSSATVYGSPASLPIREDFPVSATNPYGRCKLFCEDILRDLHLADPTLNIAILRYFNPVGAHASGQIGEDPRGIPNNLVPYLSQVAVGKRQELMVFGNDYPTSDGTGVRDYIHVVDLAKGHLRVLEKLQETPGLLTYNLGTGRGYSVLEMVAAFAKVCGHPIPYQIVARRPGDIAACYTDPSLAARELGWKAERDLAEMCCDTWRWQTNNPDGYR